MQILRDLDALAWLLTSSYPKIGLVRKSLPDPWPPRLPPWPSRSPLSAPPPHDEAWLGGRCGRHFAAVIMKWPSRSVSTMKPRPSHTLTTDRRQSSNACDMVISRCVANDHGAGPVGARGRLADVNAPSLISNASVIARPSAIITATAARHDQRVWHGGHFALRWNATNLRCDRIPGGNAKPDRERSPDQRAASPTIDCPIWCPNSQSPRRLGGADRLHHNRIPTAAYRILLH